MAAHRPQALPAGLTSAFERSAHPFLMWEGLAQVPETLEGTLRPERREEIAGAADGLDTLRVLHVVGCGTSYFAAIAATYAFSAIAGVLAVAHDAFEFAGYPPSYLDRSGLIAISHTGGTESVTAAVRLAEAGGAITVGLTDVPDSPLARSAGRVVLGAGGREPALPKTRSYVASLLKLFLLAVEVGGRRGRDVEAYAYALAAAPGAAASVLNASAATAARIGAASRGGRIVIVGAGPNVATAGEGALKLQEAAQDPAQAFELEEVMHGPWVAINPGDLVILLAFSGPGLPKARGFAAALHGVGAEVWTITDSQDGIPFSTYETYLGPGVPECLSPLCAILPLYQFTYHVALARVIRPDAMRMTDERYLAARLALPR